jgi:glutaredoxin
METAKKKLRLYTLSTCPMCKRAKAALAALGLDCEVIEVDTLDSGEQWLVSKELKKYNPKGTYPTLVIEEILTHITEETIGEALGLR